MQLIVEDKIPTYVWNKAGLGVSVLEYATWNASCLRRSESEKSPFKNGCPPFHFVWEDYWNLEKKEDFEQSKKMYSFKNIRKMETIFVASRDIVLVVLGCISPLESQSSGVASNVSDWHFGSALNSAAREMSTCRNVYFALRILCIDTSFPKY